MCPGSDQLRRAGPLSVRGSPPGAPRPALPPRRGRGAQRRRGRGGGNGDRVSPRRLRPAPPHGPGPPGAVTAAAAPPARPHGRPKSPRGECGAGAPRGSGTAACAGPGGVRVPQPRGAGGAGRGLPRSPRAVAHPPAQPPDTRGGVRWGGSAMPRGAAPTEAAHREPAVGVCPAGVVPVACSTACWAERGGSGHPRYPGAHQGHGHGG